jgi:thiol-disulfide isomerase/thioredoxin
MKNLKILVLLPALFAFQPAFSQTDAHLNLSDQFPAAGEKISITYDPAGTVVDGKNDIAATVYYIDNKDYPAADIDLKQDGKLLKGNITVPDSAKAFFIKISSADLIDNNNEKGYMYLVYKDKQPVKGANAAEAYVISSGLGSILGKIKMDGNGVIALYKKEFDLYPQSEKEYSSVYYPMIARNPDYKATIIQKIADLQNSANEKDLMLAANLLKVTKNTKSADSLNAVIKTKFPDGVLVKNELGTTFYKEKDLTKKDSLYQVYIKKYPESANDKNPVQDNFRVQLASAYLEKADFDNSYKYESQVKDKSNLAMIFNNRAYEWAKKGEHLNEAEKFSKESLDILTEKMKNPVAVRFYSPSQTKQDNEFSYYSVCSDTYAYILLKENKFAEALKYEQKVIDHSKTIDPDVYGNYIQILVALGQDAKAKEIAETTVKAGQGSVAIKDILKKQYIKAKGNDSGFDDYITALENDAKIKAREDLAKTMIDKPAPLFALKDLNGKSYSLTEMKGKVVIVDFWATWCGPCKASLPGMQMVVNKYKDNPNVVFLFVDCWETDSNYLDGVKKFIAENKYSFDVLMDEKGEDGRQSKVVSTFGVDGIPTKFIIDKNGHIRFKYVGYSGAPEKLLDEVTNMVEMTENPDAVVSSQVSLNK